MQIIIKIINNSIKLNNIVFILLIFKVYPWIINKNILLLLIIKKIKAIRIIIKEIYYFYIKR